VRARQQHPAALGGLVQEHLGEIAGAAAAAAAAAAAVFRVCARVQQSDHTSSTQPHLVASSRNTWRGVQLLQMVAGSVLLVLPV
jgi:hypothetical protein